jgi:ribonuclease R
MEREGLVRSDDHGRIGYAPAKPKSSKGGGGSNRVVGTLRVTRRGIGFVRAEGVDGDIMVAPKFMHTALHGDTVAVVIFARPAKHRRPQDDGAALEGEIVEVITRTLTRVTGTVQDGRSFSFVVPDDARIGRDIYISKEDAKKATHGDKVVVELLPWTDEHRNPEGVVLEVLGRSGDARVEVTSVARSFGLPERFPDPALREAEQLPGTIAESDLVGRVDCRSLVCFTIDPEDAKDFDDALSCEPLRDGAVRLGVHIADVSHYVREGTALDAEGYVRGTSVYMVNEVIPMLPERLSNDLCSLRPNVDRLTYSVFMDVSEGGRVDDYRIAKSVIRSARRFTYEEVQSIIDRGDGERAEQVLRLHTLARVLLKRRMKQGSIDFDTGEVKFKFDASGLPSAIVKKERLDAHRLVEECMLLANKTVAEHIGRPRKGEEVRPFLYRVHDVPDPGQLRDLAQFVKQFGFSLDAKQGVPSKELQKLLERIHGSEVENLINEVALRSMAKAVYSEKNIGHYGLAFPCYTHFTSPIRRYPDLVVHRLLEAYERGAGGQTLADFRKRLPEISRQTSARERLAMEAERASVKVMQVEYMKRHVGDEFEGLIGGVTSFGIFVEINDLLVEGLVRVRDLEDDYYLFDEKQYLLRGRSRGKVYRLGDHVRVRVVGVDPENRDIDFAIID